MAESNCIKSKKSIGSIVFEDGTPSTPLTYTVTFFGDVTITPGGRNLVDIRNADGTFATHAPIEGEDQPTTFSLSGMMRGTGAVDGGSSDLADIGLVDFIAKSGQFANVVSTASATCPNTQKTMTVKITFTDDAGTSTYTLPLTTFTGSITSAFDGNQIAIEGTSRAAYPTITHA